MKKELQARPYTAWELIKAYWNSEQRWSAYLLLLSVIAISMILVGIEVAITNWYNFF